MNKKVVHYDSKMDVQEHFGGGVCLYPVDYPDNFPVSNTCIAITSRVVDWNKETGRIETQNTIYVPLNEDNPGCRDDS